MKYADRRGSPLRDHPGLRRARPGEIQVKDLIGSAPRSPAPAARPRGLSEGAARGPVRRRPRPTSWPPSARCWPATAADAPAPHAGPAGVHPRDESRSRPELALLLCANADQPPQGSKGHRTHRTPQDWPTPSRRTLSPRAGYARGRAAGAAAGRRVPRPIGRGHPAPDVRHHGRGRGANCACGPNTPSRSARAYLASPEPAEPAALHLWRPGLPAARRRERRVPAGRHRILRPAATSRPPTPRCSALALEARAAARRSRSPRSGSATSACSPRCSTALDAAAGLACGSCGAAYAQGQLAAALAADSSDAGDGAGGEHAGLLRAAQRPGPAGGPRLRGGRADDRRHLDRRRPQRRRDRRALPRAAPRPTPSGGVSAEAARCSTASPPIGGDPDAGLGPDAGARGRSAARPRRARSTLSTRAPASSRRAASTSSSIAFSAAFGRNLDYYTGFVFEIRDGARAADRGAEPLVGGGRYDGLLQTLGAPTRCRRSAARIWLDRLAGATRMSGAASATPPLILAVPSKGRLQENAVGVLRARRPALVAGRAAPATIAAASRACRTSRSLFLSASEIARRAGRRRGAISASPART